MLCLQRNHSQYLKNTVTCNIISNKSNVIRIAKQGKKLVSKLGWVCLTDSDKEDVSKETT